MHSFEIPAALLGSGPRASSMRSSALLSAASTAAILFLKGGKKRGFEGTVL